MCSGIPFESGSTELALGPGGVVDAAEAVSGVWVTELGGALRVRISTAVTWNTSSRRFVGAGSALVTLRTGVPVKALVTSWGATGICTGNSKHQEVVMMKLRANNESNLCNTATTVYFN